MFKQCCAVIETRFQVLCGVVQCSGRPHPCNLQVVSFLLVRVMLKCAHHAYHRNHAELQVGYGVKASCLQRIVASCCMLMVSDTVPIVILSLLW